MFTLQNAVIAITLILLVWYVAGSWINRRRAQQLIQVIRQAVPAVGAKPTIKWYGRSAFQVDVGEPHQPFTGFHVLCLLEPRDFALALGWSRLRGHRDQVLIRADFRRAPRQAAKPDPTPHSIKGLKSVELRPEQPHLQLSLYVGAGDETSIAQCFGLAQQFGH